MVYYDPWMKYLAGELQLKKLLLRSKEKMVVRLNYWGSGRLGLESHWSLYLVCEWKLTILLTKWVWSFMDYFFEFRPILGPLISKFLSIGIQKNFLRFPTKFRLELRHFLKFNFTFKVWIKLFTKKACHLNSCASSSSYRDTSFSTPLPPPSLK